MQETLGFIGLGVMGRPMARNLVAKGFDVVVHTRDADVLQGFADDGVATGKDPADVARRASVIITMLPTGDVVEAVMTEPGGVFEGASDGALVIDMSTIEPAVSRELAEKARARGVAMLDAPVSGGDVGAHAGTLSIMVGGDAREFERARPVFEALGTTITHVGPHGAGQVVKACNQVVVGVTFAAVSEALVLGSKAGIDPAVILDVLGGGLAGNRIMVARRQNFLNHDFTPGFTVDLHHKDLNIALATGEELQVPLAFTAAVQQMLRQLQAQGNGGWDHSGLMTLVEGAAAHAVGPANRGASPAGDT